MENLSVNDQPAIKIKAKRIQKMDNTSKYDCEGDKVWIANSCCIYNEKEHTLLIQEWLYNRMVKEGKL